MVVAAPVRKIVEERLKEEAAAAAAAAGGPPSLSSLRRASLARASGSVPRCRTFSRSASSRGGSAIGATPVALSSRKGGPAAAAVAEEEQKAAAEEEVPEMHVACPLPDTSLPLELDKLWDLQSDAALAAVDAAGSAAEAAAALRALSGLRSGSLIEMRGRGRHPYDVVFHCMELVRGVKGRAAPGRSQLFYYGQ